MGEYGPPKSYGLQCPHSEQKLYFTRCQLFDKVDSITLWYWKIFKNFFQALCVAVHLTNHWFLWKQYTRVEFINRNWRKI